MVVVIVRGDVMNVVCLCIVVVIVKGECGWWCMVVVIVGGDCVWWYMEVVIVGGNVAIMAGGA